MRGNVVNLFEKRIVRLNGELVNSMIQNPFRIPDIV